MPDSILAVKKPGWFELRFVEDHKKVHSNCAVCEPIKGGAVVLEVEC